MKYKNILLLSFLLLIVSTIYFLQDKTHGNYAPDWQMVLNSNGTIKSVEYNENKVAESFGFGVYRNYDPVVSMNLTQHLKEKQNFEGYANIANAMKKENQYLLFALLDYKQIPFYINGSKNETHLVSLGPMEEHFYPFKIDGLPPGSHDLLIGVFLNPYFCRKRFKCDSRVQKL